MSAVAHPTAQNRTPSPFGRAGRPPESSLPTPPGTQAATTRALPQAGGMNDTVVSRVREMQVGMEKAPTYMAVKRKWVPRAPFCSARMVLLHAYDTGSRITTKLARTAFRLT